MQEARAETFLKHFIRSKELYESIILPNDKSIRDARFSTHAYTDLDHSISDEGFYTPQVTESTEANFQLRDNSDPIDQSYAALESAVQQSLSQTDEEHTEVRGWVNEISEVSNKKKPTEKNIRDMATNYIHLMNSPNVQVIYEFNVVEIYSKIKKMQSLAASLSGMRLKNAKKASDYMSKVLAEYQDAKKAGPKLKIFNRNKSTYFTQDANILAADATNTTRKIRVPSYSSNNNARTDN